MRLAIKLFSPLACRKPASCRPVVRWGRPPPRMAASSASDNFSLPQAGPGLAACTSTPAAASLDRGRCDVGVEIKGQQQLPVDHELEPIGVRELPVQELKLLIERSPQPPDTVFVDVREPEEFEMSSLPSFSLFPMSRWREWADDLTVCCIPDRFDLEHRIIILCHHGVRSRQAAELFIRAGFRRVENVSGGIDLYARLADKNVPRY